MIPESPGQRNGGDVSATFDTTEGTTEDTTETFTSQMMAINVDDICRQAEYTHQLLVQFQHDPVMYQVLQEQLLPLVAPLARTLESQDFDEENEAYPFGDTFNARALVLTHRHEMRYATPWKAWLTWTGTHWQRDESGLMWRWLRHTLLDMVAAMVQHDPETTGKCQAHLTKSLQTPRMEGALKAATSWVGVSIGGEGQPQWDTDLWILNCANGTLDLRTVVLRPHHPDDLLTKCLPVAYDPAATCPEWEKFLRRIMGAAQGPDDPDMGSGELENRRLADVQAQELIDFQQRYVGYALTGVTHEQCFCLLHGSGANGKSTYLETLRALLGDYAMATPSASLLARERQGGIPNDIARLRGARLVTAVELGEGKRLDEELVKRLSGQDTITARFLRAEFFDFTPEFKLLVACNHLPMIGENEQAIWRRIHCVPFAVTIPETEQDKDLRVKLREELPGILAWAVRGCLAWQQKGLEPPEIVRRTTDAYRSDMNVLGRFLEECCVRIDQASIKAGDLYTAYKDWCNTSGETAVMSLTAMGKRLDVLGITKHTSNYIWRLGIGLKDRHAQEETPRYEN